MYKSSVIEKCYPNFYFLLYFCHIQTCIDDCWVIWMFLLSNLFYHVMSQYHSQTLMVKFTVYPECLMMCVPHN